jgi:hypothetical protein
MVLARSAFEIAIHVMWVLNPSDPFEREARLLVRLADYAHNYNRLVREVEGVGGDASGLHSRQQIVQKCHNDLKAKLLEVYSGPIMKQLPKIIDMFKDIGLDRDYARYVYSSQFVHASMMAGEIYRDGIFGRSLEERIAPVDWAGPLSMAWMTLDRPWRLLLERTGGKSDGFPAPGLARRMKEALGQLAQELR